MKRVFRVEVEDDNEAWPSFENTVYNVLKSRANFASRYVFVEEITCAKDDPKDEIKVGIDVGDLKKTLDLLEEILRVQREMAERPLPVINIPSWPCPQPYLTWTNPGTYTGSDGIHSC